MGSSDAGILTIYSSNDACKEQVIHHVGPTVVNAKENEIISNIINTGNSCHTCIYKLYCKSSVETSWRSPHPGSAKLSNKAFSIDGPSA